LDQKSVLSHPCSFASEEIYENEGYKEEGDALSELRELVKSLSTEIEQLKTEHESCLFEENAKDFPVLEEDVLGSSIEDDDEDFMTVEAFHSSPEVSIVPILTHVF
jgi:hypothetical protein